MASTSARIGFTLTAALLGSFLTPSHTQAVTVNFSPSPLASIPTHEGGLIGFLSEVYPPDPTAIAYAATLGPKIFRAMIDIGWFKSSPLDGAFFTSLQNGFDYVRANGIKIIPRFGYSFTGSGGDAPLSIVLNHIAQLRPILVANRDIISYLEAGFIGEWGEWHSSTNGLDSESSKDLIKEALLESFPIEKQVLFTHPTDIMRWFPSGRSPLTPADGAESDPQNVQPLRSAMNPAQRARSDARRVGFHNDSFLSGNFDGYRWPPPHTDTLQTFMREWNKNGMFGGGMSDIVPQRRTCFDITSEGPGYRVGFLNQH